jgi:hypothetical protein
MSAVTLSVRRYLLHPILGIRFHPSLAIDAPLATVPKAAVYKEGYMSRREDQVRLAWERFDMKPEAQALTKEELPDRHLRSGVL